MPAPDRDRPDPDLLLAQLQQEEAGAKRGTLRICFGASAGVGKTYAMLAAARKLKEEGRDVVLGIVETHGRAEAAALLEGLPAQIWAENNPGGGAKFSFTLPLGTPPEMPTDVREPSESQAAQL